MKENALFLSQCYEIVGGSLICDLLRAIRLKHLTGKRICLKLDNTGNKQWRFYYLWSISKSIQVIKNESHSDLKVYNAWVPKYRKSVLIEEVAIRSRNLLRKMALEHELVIAYKVAKDHVHVFLSYRLQQVVSKIVQWLKGTRH